MVQGSRPLGASGIELGRSPLDLGLTGGRNLAVGVETRTGDRPAATVEANGETQEKEGGLDPGREVGEGSPGLVDDDDCGGAGQCGRTEEGPSDPAADSTYYVADPLGMTRMELSATGDILAQSDMTPFGQLINRHSDADEVPFTGGEQYDTESGLYSYKYRSYNPQLGRWMSPDPSDEEFARVSNPQSLNLYSYVINDPLKYVDRLGLATACICYTSPDKCINTGLTDIDGQPILLPPPDANHNHKLVVRMVQGQVGNLANHITVQVDGAGEVGFGPLTPMTKAQILANASVNGTVEPRAAGVATLNAVTIYLTADEANAATNMINFISTFPGQYQVLGSSCVDFGEIVMSATGFLASTNSRLPSLLITDTQRRQVSHNSVQAP